MTVDELKFPFHKSYSDGNKRVVQVGRSKAEIGIILSIGLTPSHKLYSVSIIIIFDKEQHTLNACLLHFYFLSGNDNSDWPFGQRRPRILHRRSYGSVYM